MPRVHINLHDIDEIEELEEQENWEELIGLSDTGQRTRAVGAEQRGQPNPAGRKNGRFRELRIGGSESLDRKRSERRKQVYRSARRV
jgi:hypothetical protein